MRFSRVVLLCLPLAAALLCSVCAVFAPDQSTIGYAVEALSRSAVPLLMLVWPLWALLLWALHRVSGRQAFLSAIGLMLMGIPPRCAPPPQPGEVIVIVSNVNTYTGNDARLEGFFAQQGADAIITVERRGADISGMVRVADNYSESLPRPSHGSAAYCRDPTRCTATVSAQIGSETFAMPVVQLRLAGSCLLGLHAPPPYPHDPTGMQPYVTAILERIREGRMRTSWGACAAGDPVVVAGDLNAVPGSGPYRRMLSAGLRDPRRWAGVYGLTWPTGGGWPGVPLMRLDHVFIGAVQARLLRTVRIPDGDHKALVLALPEGLGTVVSPDRCAPAGG